MTPLFDWVGFHVLVLLLLAAEWLMVRRVADTHRKAVYATILWVVAALLFAGWIWRSFHAEAATQYLAGYAIEEALSVDNLFVFLLLFRSFGIPEERQQRVLFWGVAGAIVMRGSFIAAGLGLLEHFGWIEYVFGIILLIAAVRLLFPEKEEEKGKQPAWLRWLTRIQPVSASQETFLAREHGKLMPTVLLLALIAVELTDVVFALDSIPAVLSITREPFVAYTSNIMAVLGLRSLYVLLAALLTHLRFLHFGLSALLSFAAVKMLIAHWVAIGPLWSLAVIVGLLAITIAVSLAFPARAGAQEAHT